MNELSLFSGAGGGLLGTALLGFRSIGYIEWDDYCQRVIAARIKDGILPDAPIFGDIKTFIHDGYAASYTGLVDVVTAGFPCQPFSIAGKQKGADDERNMWPATAECIRIVRPRFVLLENVPGIRRYLPVVVRDLRRLGYVVSRPLILGADDVGAPHRRKRVWILARNADARFREWYGEIREISLWESPNANRSYQHAPNPIGVRCAAGSSPLPGEEGGAAFSCDADRDAPNAPELHDRGYLREEENGQVQQFGNGDEPSITPDPSGQGLPIGEMFGGDISEERQASIGGPWEENWSEVATRLCRVDDGVASRVDRLKAIGNGQVPRVVKLAWETLIKC